MALRNAPPWWNWELELTPHVELRMDERGLTEVEVRALLQGADSLAPDATEGRFRIRARRGGHWWVVVLEPDEESATLVLVTVFKEDSSP